ncbi:MAG: hypothetical protein KC766_13900 [Myxococcales bacterium]|nr:hypothetical protein [Myxococcales bacterium]
MAALTSGWTQPVEPTVGLPLFKGLVGALTRQRASTRQRAFVKFVTFHTLYLDLLRAAFPHVPFLFVYRDPVEIMVSIERQNGPLLARVKGGPASAAWTGLDRRVVTEMSDMAYHAAVFRRCLTALLAHDGPISLVRYRDISPASIGRILERAFDYRPSTTDLHEMQAQFGFCSKAPDSGERFTADSALKRRAATSELRRTVERELEPLVRSLDGSANRITI